MKPQTGLWYALPGPKGFRILARRIPNREDYAHPRLWAEEAVPLLTKSLGLGSAAARELDEAPYGCPRGRVVSPQEHTMPGHRGHWVVLYGGDEELPPSARPALLKAFGLAGKVRWVLDDHERMLPEDREVVLRLTARKATGR